MDSKEAATDSEVWGLAVVAVITFLFSCFAGLAGVVSWLAYFFVGAPMMKVGMFLARLISPAGEAVARELRVFVYIFWLLVVPTLAIGALAVSFFRFVLDEMG
ncbi:MAG TPA: hypothetical protein VGB70_05170 [Allosphingosinicella sp.]|jgi:hypothetical protein